MSTQTDFLTAINQIAAERGLDVDSVLESIKEAIRSGFRNMTEEEGASLKVEIDPAAGDISVYADKKVVEDVTNPQTQISLEQAQKLEPKLRVGDHVEVDVTPDGDFGRVAAQAARQVIMQKLRERERDVLLAQFQNRMGEVESAIIQRVDGEGNVILEINRAIAIMPQQERIVGEFYRSGSRVKVLLKEIREDAKGKTLIASRSHPDFLRALFALEVPEIASGTVEIMAIAREAGSRSKIAVRSNADGVDPIGSCVGQRGVRINAVSNELKMGDREEKIDIINWDDETGQFISNAIKPADAIEVKLIDEEERQALILVDDEALSLAIGKEGQNVRLAAKLTGWSLDIQGVAAYKENGEMSTFESEGEQESDDGQTTEDGERSTEHGQEESGTGDQDEQMSDDGPQMSDDEDRASSIESLDLGTRIENALDAAGIDSVEKLREAIDAGEDIKGVGAKSVEKIQAALK